MPTISCLNTCGIVTDKEKKASGKERIINCGSIPGRYLMIEVEKGVPLPSIDKIRVFGIRFREIEERMGPGATNLLFDKTYQLVYGFE